jgi:CheY-like chemotaxis protein
MKLEYKILWLDDKIEEFKELEVIEEVETHLKENGFIPNIITVDNSTDFFSNLNDSYDLILTDFHMNDMNGDEVVQTIRSNKYSVMTEILFYTAKADLKDAQKISRVSFLETNSTTDAHIEKVISRTIELIDLTIKKFQHIVTMRGMIMHETSSLDELSFDIITEYLEKTDNAEIKSSIFDEIISFYERKFKDITKFKKNGRIDKVINDPLLFSFSQRANTLSAIINQNDLDNFIDDFKTSVIKVRNQFAHAVLEQDEFGNDIFRNKSENIIFNDELCKKIRENIIEHKNNLDDLKRQLKE